MVLHAIIFWLDQPRQDQAVGARNPTNATETLNPVIASFTRVNLRPIFQNTCRIKSFFPYKDRAPKLL